MAYQSLEIGTAANDGTGDTLRAGGDKINDNFSEIYTLLGTGTALTSGFTNGVDPRPLSKPLIINGDMAVAQRATSVTGHNAVSYTTVDRFKTVCETGTYTVIQESLTSGNACLNGFKKALRLDTTTAEASTGSAGEQTTIEQRIEGQNLQQF